MPGILDAILKLLDYPAQGAQWLNRGLSNGFRGSEVVVPAQEDFYQYFPTSRRPSISRGRGQGDITYVSPDEFPPTATAPATKDDIQSFMRMTLGDRYGEDITRAPHSLSGGFGLPQGTLRHGGGFSFGSTIGDSNSSDQSNANTERNLAQLALMGVASPESRRYNPDVAARLANATSIQEQNSRLAKESPAAIRKTFADALSGEIANRRAEAADTAHAQGQLSDEEKAAAFVQWVQGATRWGPNGENPVSFEDAMAQYKAARGALPGVQDQKIPTSAPAAGEGAGVAVKEPMRYETYSGGEQRGYSAQGRMALLKNGKWVWADSGEVVNEKLYTGPGGK